MSWWARWTDAAQPFVPGLDALPAVRPLGPADAGAVVRLRSRPNVCLYVPFEPMDREAIPRHITVGWARQRVTAEGEALFLGAELASVGEVIADVTLWFQGAERRPGEVGWVFNPDPSRQGYATEAVQRRPAPGVRPARAAPRGGQVDARNDASLRFAGRASGAARTKFHVLR